MYHVNNIFRVTVFMIYMMSDLPCFVDRMKCEESEYMKIHKFELREKQ